MARPKKIIHFKVKQFKNNSGTLSFQVAGTMPDGTRIRRNFAEKAEALRELADREQEAAGSPERRRSLRTTLTQEQLLDAESAIQQARHIPLTKIVSQYHSLRDRALAKGVGLEQAIHFFEARYRPEAKSITIFNAMEEYLRTRKGLADKTQLNYDSGLGQLLLPDPNKNLHAFTVMDIEIVIERYSNLNTRKTYRRVFSVFFNWAVRHHYCLENPCDRLDKMPSDMSQIASLSLEECKRLLYAAMKLQDGAAAAAVAMGLFAGLRPSEIRDLSSSDILEDRLKVSGGKMRRTIKRRVPIPPALEAWLKEFKFTGMPSGWNSKLKELKKATKAKKWVQDIIRHTSITFQTERDKNEALTAYNCGTSIQMMNRHYRGSIDNEKIINEFWGLTPAKLRAKPPEVHLEIKRRVEWPDKAALKKLVWLKPLIHAAQDIEVSDVALRKRCVKLGIELPTRGHWLKNRKSADQKTAFLNRGNNERRLLKS